MKVLFICHSYLKGNNGGIYASKAYINAFATLADEMTLLYPYKKGMEIAVLSAMKEAAENGIIVKGGKFLEEASLADTVVFDNSVESSGLIKKFKRAGFQTITIHHNYQVEFIKGDMQLYLLIPSLFWTLKYEKEAVVFSDVNITLTQQDVELFRKNYCKDARFLVGGVFEYLAHCNRTTENKFRGHSYIITGWLASKQTEDSLIPWIHNYYPILKKVDPLAQLTIAGKDPS